MITNITAKQARQISENNRQSKQIINRESITDSSNNSSNVFSAINAIAEIGGTTVSVSKYSALDVEKLNDLGYSVTVQAYPTLGVNLTITW